MNSNQIEQLAVAHIIELFSVCERICPQLNTGDKKPLWDGELFLYNSNDHSNEALVGRVPCQVKGRANADSPESVKFYITKNDLSNYLKDGGVLFFVVYVESPNKTSYWAKLTPVELRGYMAKLDKTGNKGISIKLHHLPEDVKTYESDVFEFHQHCDFQKASPVKIEQVATIGSRFHVTDVHTYGLPPIVALTKGYHYVYQCDENGNVQNVVGDCKYAFELSKVVDDRIIVGDKEYMIPVKEEIAKGVSFYKVGNFLKIDGDGIKENERKMNFSVAHVTGVKERALALQVLLDMDEFESFSFPKLEKRFSCSDVSLTESTKEDIKGDLFHTQRIVDLLNRLHIAEDVDMSSLPEKEQTELITLYGAIMENNPVHPNFSISDDSAKFSQIKIGELEILVVISNEDNEYFVKDFFEDKEVEVGCIDNETKEKYSVSRFSLLDATDYKNLSNINWTLIPADYEKLDMQIPEVIRCVNQDVVNLLTAYDESNRDEILDAAIRLSAWLWKAKKDSEDGILFRINNLQAIKRRGELSEDEKKEISGYAEGADASAELRYCCDILLEDATRTAIHFNQMSQEKQDYYKTHPISHLAK